jgi:hypothetical protein
MPLSRKAFKLPCVGTKETADFRFEIAHLVVRGILTENSRRLEDRAILPGVWVLVTAFFIAIGPEIIPLTYCFNIFLPSL